jgi:PAS domain S-box-containing protein
LSRPGDSYGSCGAASAGFTQQAFEDILQFAALICGTPYATIAVPDSGIATWCRSAVVTQSSACPTHRPFDEYAAQRMQFFEIAEVAADERFAAAKPIVDGKAVAFYAGAPLVSGDGRLLGTMAVLDHVPRQLTPEQRAALLALARQAATWLALCEQFAFARALIESSPAAIYHTDTHGRLTHGNPEYRRIYGLGPKEPLDEWVHGVHPEDRSRMDAAWADFCRNPRPVVFEWRGVEHDGASRVYTEQVVAARGIAGFVGTITDITERMDARARLRRTETLFQNTFEQAPIGVIYADKAGRVLRANKVFCDQLGFDQRQIESLSIAEITHDEDIAHNRGEFERLWRGEIGVIYVEKRYLRKDRRPLWVGVTTSLVRDASGGPICAVEFVKDISARRDLAAALLQNQRLLKAVIADLPFAIRACDMEGRVFLHNPAAAELFAIDASDDSGPKPQAPGEGGVSLFLPDGKTPVADENRPLARALRGETVFNVELVIAPSGGAGRTTLNSARLLADHDGGYLGAVAVTQDVTEQRKLERDLAHAQKLESIGQLAAGIAHEINTPTQFIGDNVRFLHEAFGDLLKLTSDLQVLVADATSGGGILAPVAAAIGGLDMTYLQDEIPKAILQSLEGVERIAKIVGAMKEFSHPATERTPLDINRAIASTITVASNEWKYVADLRTEFDSRLPLVPVMPGAFNQVILNMIVNAAHAIGAATAPETQAKGTITITTRRVDGWAEIRITDTGCGIPADVIPRIFDPFYTTKLLGKGTGQGLTIAHDVVVAKHGGTIAVDSKPGVGTTFILRLPLEAEVMGQQSCR